MPMSCKSLHVLSMRVGWHQVKMPRFTAVVMVVIVSVVVEGDAIELLEWICQFAQGCRKTGV